MQYDVIGDIHGHCSALEMLLEQLGYERRLAAWCHPERMAIFVGDFVDRGPEQLEVLQTVRRMIDAGSALAVQGNHEFNAVGFANRDAQGYLRPRGSKNLHQHRAFLDAVGLDSDAHQEWTDWFKTLPLWLDLPEIRVVHACWDDDLMRQLQPFLVDGNLLPEDLSPFFRKGNPQYEATEVVLKGREVALPEGVVFHDKEGIARKNTRIKWWDATATCLGTAAVDDAFGSSLSEVPLPEGTRLGYDDDKPVLFGHYWMPGTPRLLGSKTACVDFSVAKDGVLCAYSFDGETDLDASKLSWVPSSPLRAPALR